MASTTATKLPRYEAGTPVTAEEYERIALADLGRKWELHDGRLREKPGMTWDHVDVITELVYFLRHQLDRRQFRVHMDNSRLRRSTGTYFIPDVAVIPLRFGQGLRGRKDRLETYDAPLPLVVEVWSPSTGAYDLTEKIAEYRRRGDTEIWRIHPYERTLTAWRRQPDGGYTETVVTRGTVQPVALPNVTIDLDALLDS